MKIGFRQIDLGLFILAVCSFVIYSCGKDFPEEDIFRDVALGESFTMEPGDKVRFQEPFDYRLVLLGFEDFPKQENTLATATANFEYFIPNGSGGLIL